MAARWRKHINRLLIALGLLATVPVCVAQDLNPISKETNIPTWGVNPAEDRYNRLALWGLCGRELHRQFQFSRQPSLAQSHHSLSP